MADSPSWDGVRTRRWTRWGLITAGSWAFAGWLAVPFVIRSAYADGLFGFLGGLMPGRHLHAVDVYLGQWQALALLVLLGLVVAWAVGLVLMQPVTHRRVRQAWSLIPTFGDRFRRRTVAVAAVLLIVTVCMQLFYLPGAYETARGHEYQRIATSLAAGEGFSFPPGLRWLYLESEPEDAEYGATAWKEPIYPAFIAVSLMAFGERYGRLMVVIAQLTFLVATCLLIYHLGCRLFGPGAGIAAALLIIALPDLHYIHTVKMQVPGISGLFLVGGLALMLRYSDAPSPRRAAVTGVFLGVAALAHAVLLVLVPIGALYVLLHRDTEPGRVSLKPPLLLCIAAALTISPWTVRNYIQFGHVIPVQTGFGLFANVSNSYLAESYLDGLNACGDGSPPVYRAEGPYDAVRTFQESEPTIHAVHGRTVACVAAAWGDAYHELNEHERDGLHRQQLATFVRENPRAFLELTATKGLMYLLDLPVRGRGTPLLAVVGLLGLAWVATRPGLWVFPLAILAYATPFAVGAPMYFRYQAPLEPIYALFAVAVVAALLRRPFEWLRAAWIGMGRQ
jgi:hypothetical protein